MSLVWERAPYTAGSLIVLLALADWANDEGVAWPSMERLALKARIDRRSAQRIVRQLEKDGVLEIEHGGGRAKQHKYVLKMETATFCRPLSADEKGDISGAETATLDPEKATSDAQRATSDPETATPTSPDPLDEPSVVDPSEDPSDEPPYKGQDFLQALAAYDRTAHQRKVKESPEQRILLFKKLARWGEAGATEALENSVVNSWRGVFEPVKSIGNGKNSKVENSMDAVRRVLAEKEARRNAVR